MDIQEKSCWAKSTESRIESFFDQYLISSMIPGVRESMQTLLFSLFKKGNSAQKSIILKLILSRCENLTWMGKASLNFLGLIKEIFNWSPNFKEEKMKILNAIFRNLDQVNQRMAENPNYDFYAFASNLIDFGNKEFKPYLLEANGCLNCFGCLEDKPDFFTKLDSFLDIHKVFTNKLEYVFKRYYQISDLSIVLKTTNKFKSLSVYYLDLHKQYKLLKKYRPGENILIKETIKAEGILFEFEMPLTKRETVHCIFCNNLDDINCVCSNCPRKADKIEINGKFKVIGADQEKLSKELCQDYQRLRDIINTIKSVHTKIQLKQKVNFNFGTEQMYQIYQRIVNNMRLLNKGGQSTFTGRQDKNCFSCNFYQASNMASFLKDILFDIENYPYSSQQLQVFKVTIRKCLGSNSIQTIRSDLIETLAKMYLISNENNFKQDLEKKEITNNNTEIFIYILKSMKQKKKPEPQIQATFKKIINDAEIVESLSIHDKIKLFVCYYLDWEYLSQIDSFNHKIEIKRLFEGEIKNAQKLLDFNFNQIFNLNLDCYLKAFLKIIPSSILPKVNLNSTETEFLHYLDNKVPKINKEIIQNNIIRSTRSMIKLDMFNCLSTLIDQLSIKQSMPVMNQLFPYRAVWNLNIIQACEQYEHKISELSPPEQIALCLNGYNDSKEYLYIERIHKLVVPQRLNFVIRLDPPIDQIDRMSFQYPYIPIRQIRSDQLQGDTIQALHDWVYAQLQKMNQGMPLDIIVQKNIIDNMDLPIEVIFQNYAENKSKKVIGNKTYDFFRVIYRIQGILGQPKQRSIGNPRDQKLQTCISYSSHFLDKIDDSQKKVGLDVLMQILEEVKSSAQFQRKKIILFQILSSLSLNEALCKKIIQGQYGDSIINATVRLMSFENQRDAKITNFLLQLSSKVIDEANQEMTNLRKGSTSQQRKLSGFDMDVQYSSDSEIKVKYVLEKFLECQKNFEKSGNILYRNIAKRLIKLLPFCSKDETQPSKNLFDFFQCANWSLKSSPRMEFLLIFMETLSESYMTFKKICRDSLVTDQIISSILENVRKEGEETVDESKLSNKRSIVETALLLLCSLIQGDQQLQERLFDQKIFHNIYEISLIGPKRTVEIKAGKVPQNCYKIIKYFSQGKIVDSRISEFIKSKKEDEKNTNKPKKNKKWEMIKNKQKNIMLSKNVSEEEKDLIVCSTCHQGYSKRKDVLGLYIYFTKNQIPQVQNWWKQNRKFNSYTSTTFFTAIHYECHMKAYEADQKIPLSEWDGALIRNMDVLCNGWIPFKGVKVTNDEFARVQRKYFERNKGGNYWNVIQDLKGLLHKLSIDFDFAKESKGSSYSHNIRYIPILMGFASYMIEKNRGDQNIDEGVKYFLDSPPTKIPNLILFLTVGLFSLNYIQFNEIKKNALKTILNTKKEDTSEEQWFVENKKHILYLKMIEQIFQILHKNLSQMEGEKKLHQLLEEHIQNEFDAIIGSFQKLGGEYKNQYTKYTSIAEYAL